MLATSRTTMAAIPTTMMAAFVNAGAIPVSTAMSKMTSTECYGESRDDRYDHKAF